jgi:hypothetical protein
MGTDPELCAWCGAPTKRFGPPEEALCRTLTRQVGGLAEGTELRSLCFECDKALEQLDLVESV